MLIPKTKKGILARIFKYEKKLKSEKTKFGFYHDKKGLRYYIGPMYLLADEVDLSLKSFLWFEKNFPDDCGEPFQYLCWTLAYLKDGKLVEAENKIIETVLRNLYLVPHILGTEQSIINMRHSSNFEEKEYINYLPIEYEKLWDDESKEWLAKAYESKRCHQFRKRIIHIQNQLQHEQTGPQRSKLVKESSELFNLRMPSDP